MDVPVRIICANRTERDILFRAELAAIPGGTRESMLKAGADEHITKDVPADRLLAAIRASDSEPEKS
jgi:hypothetical protein